MANRLIKRLDALEQKNETEKNSDYVIYLKGKMIEYKGNLYKTTKEIEERYPHITFFFIGLSKDKKKA